MVMKPVADCGLSWLLHSRLSLNRFFTSVCSLLIIPHHISSFGHFHAVRIRDFLRDLGMDLERCLSSGSKCWILVLSATGRKDS